MKTPKLRGGTGQFAAASGTESYDLYQVKKLFVSIKATHAHYLGTGPLIVSGQAK